jgi:uncharacterized membrane protein
MDWEPWIHFAHITAAVVWVGGGLMLALLASRARRSEDLAVVAEFARLLPYAGLRVLTPSVVVVLLTGLWLVLAGSEWTLTQSWVLLALGGFALAFVIGAVYLSRTAIQLERAAITTPDLELAQAAIRRWLLGYGLVLAILVFIMWDMVFKPGL